MIIDTNFVWTGTTQLTKPKPRTSLVAAALMLLGSISVGCGVEDHTGDAPAATSSALLQLGTSTTLAGKPINAIQAQAPSDTLSPDGPIPRAVPAPGTAYEPHDPYTLAIAPALAAVWQPLNQQVEVFGIDVKGSLKDVWKRARNFWEPSFHLSGPGLAPPGAPLTAIWYPLNEQLEVFTIGMNGALTVTWKAHNGLWFAPTEITPPDFAPPGAQVTAVFQPLNNQLEVFAIDASGAVKLAWKEQNGRWQGPVALSPPGSAPPGAPITSVWQPLNEQLEVFWVDTAGALRGVWKQHNRQWAPPYYLTGGGFVRPRTKLAAVWQPLNEQLEVFAVNQAGAINVVWKEHNGRWKAPYVLGGPEIALPGTDILATWDPEGERLEVVTVGDRGNLISAWKTHNGDWKPGPGAYSAVLTAPGPSGSWPLGAALAGVVQPIAGNRRLDVFTMDNNQAVSEVARDVYVGGSVEHITTANFGPIYGAHAAYCSDILRRWSGGDDLIPDVSLQGCEDFLGITAYCTSKGGGITIGYPPQAESPRFLQCTPGSSGDDGVLDQFVHIWTGIGEGLADAAVVTLVYSPVIIQGYACLSGVLFACASLAVDLAVQADALPPEWADAIDLATDATDCVGGDIVSCAKLGAAGARAAGVGIPGEDAGQVALLVQQCADEDYAACVRLGERAAAAAGVPVARINQAAKDAQDCYSGDLDACMALGRLAARAGIPVGGIVDGADNLRRCSENPGDVAACLQLGEGIAAVQR